MMATSPVIPTQGNLPWLVAGVKGCQVPHPRLAVLLCSRHNQSSDTSLLQDLDHNVAHAVHVQHATALLQDSKSHFDAALIDCSEFGSGFADTDAKAVFAAAADSSTPVVLMCQQQCSADAVMPAVQAGAADILQRPLSRTKLQNLWQHVVRAAITHSTSAGTADSVPRQQHQQQQQQHCPSATVTCDVPVFTPQQAISDSFNLLDDIETLSGMLHADSLGGLDLPPFMPTQPDLEPLHAALSELQEDAADHMAFTRSLSAALPPGSPGSSFAGTAVAASLFDCGGPPRAPGSMGPTAIDLDMCTDVSSAKPSDESVNERRKLHACTSLCKRARWTTDMNCEQQHLRQQSLAWSAPWQQSHPCVGQVAVMPGVMNMNMTADSGNVSNMCSRPNTGSFQCPPAGMCCSTSYVGPCYTPPPALMGGGTWPAPAMLLNSGPWQLPAGMVWGMPIWNLAVAPGITQTPHNSCTPAPTPPLAPSAVCGSTAAHQETPCSQAPAGMHPGKASAAHQYLIPSVPLPPPSASGFWPMTNPSWPMTPV